MPEKSPPELHRIPTWHGEMLREVVGNPNTIQSLDPIYKVLEPFLWYAHGFGY
jgi:hypothetical protein